MLYEAFSDGLKIAAVVLAILFPAIAAYFQYRREERKLPASVGGAGMLAIGGALADRDAISAYMEKADQLTAALKLVASAQIENATALRERDRKIAEMSEELSQIRRALQDIAARAAKSVLPGRDSCP